MALTITYRASIYSTTGAASYATTSTYTPAANSLLVALVVGCGDTNDPNHATPFTGHGVTWTKKAISANALSTTHALSVWVANAGSSPTSAAATAQWLTNRTGAAIIEYEITDWDSALSAVNAIIQAVTNTGTGTSGTFAFSAAEESRNRQIAMFVHLATESTIPRTNWTEPSGGAGSFNGPATAVGTQYRADAFETTASASWASNVAWRGVGIEIAATSALAVAMVAGSLGFTGQSVGVGMPGPQTGSVTVVGHAPSVNASTGVLVPTGTVIATGNAPTVSVVGDDPDVVQPSACSLTFTGQEPFPAQSGGTIGVPRGALAFTGQSVGAAFGAPTTGTLTATGETPTATVGGGGGGGGGPQIQIPTGSLAASGGYITAAFAGPTQAALTLTGTLVEIFGVKQVPSCALALVGQAPTLHTVVPLPRVALAFTGHALTVSSSGSSTNTTIVPAQGSLGFSGGVPAPSTQGSAALSPSAGGLAFSTSTPGVGISESNPTFYVGGTLLSFQKGSLRITDNLNARNTLQCRIWSDDGTLDVDAGDDVLLIAGDGITRLFAGTVDDVSRVAVVGQDGFFVDLTAVDYNQIADRHIVAESYDDGFFNDIVADIVANYLAQDNVVVGTIDRGPTFTRKVFNYRTVAECFNELSADTGYSWWIDYSRTFYFRARDSVAAPFEVTSSNGKALRFSVRESRSNYRNRHYVRAGRDLTDPLTESFKGDGQRQTFTVGLPIGQEPTITLNGVAQTVGIRQVEDPNAFDWYWNKDSNELTQRTAGVPPTTADTLTVVYRGLFPIIVQAQDDEEIADRIAVEGGSGLYESIEDLPDVDDADLALGAATAKLARDGAIRQTIEIETDTTGLRTGQLLTVTWPTLSASGTYLINSVRAGDVQGKFIRWSATALSGDAVGGWVEFYQRMMAKQRASAIERENELLQLSRVFTDDVEAATSIVVDDDISKETRIGLAQIGRSEIGTT